MSNEALNIASLAVSSGMNLEPFDAHAYSAAMSTGGFYICHMDTVEELTSAVARVGQPLGHDNEDKIIWDVRPKTNDTSVARSHTFAEFPLHTDGSFESSPPPYIALWVLRADRFGGGVSVLVDFEAIYRRLSREADDALRRDFIWRIPKEFVKNGDCARAPVLVGEGRLRYRREIIDERHLDSARIAALDELDALLSLPELQRRFLLPDNACLFVDNTRMLHARTRINDPERHMLRMRYA